MTSFARSRGMDRACMPRPCDDLRGWQRDSWWVSLNMPAKARVACTTAHPLAGILSTATKHLACSSYLTAGAPRTSRSPPACRKRHLADRNAYCRKELIVL